MFGHFCMTLAHASRIPHSHATSPAVVVLAVVAIVVGVAIYARGER